ncbi:hypothetical protein PCE1_003648 [Barthelona sp. PCE]
MFSHSLSRESASHPLLINSRLFFSKKNDKKRVQRLPKHLCCIIIIAIIIIFLFLYPLFISLLSSNNTHNYEIENLSAIDFDLDMAEVDFNVDRMTARTRIEIERTSFLSSFLKPKIEEGKFSYKQRKSFLGFDQVTVRVFLPNTFLNAIVNVSVIRPLGYYNPFLPFEWLSFYQEDVFFFDECRISTLNLFIKRGVSSVTGDILFGNYVVDDMIRIDAMKHKAVVSGKGVVLVRNCEYCDLNINQKNSVELARLFSSNIIVKSQGSSSITTVVNTTIDFEQKGGELFVSLLQYGDVKINLDSKKLARIYLPTNFSGLIHSTANQNMISDINDRFEGTSNMTTIEGSVSSSVIPLGESTLDITSKGNIIVDLL